VKNLRWRHGSKLRRSAWASVWTLGAGALGGFYAAWPAFQEHVSTPVFAIVSTSLGMVLAGAHLLKLGGDE
jgi:hypothetical protein